jgi:hypothetical protein
LCPALGRRTRVRGAAAEFELVATRDRAVRDAWGIADAVFVDGKRLSHGPPPPYVRVLRTVQNAARRR